MSHDVDADLLEVEDVVNTPVRSTGIV